jgi:hypothetical protein
MDSVTRYTVRIMPCTVPRRLKLCLTVVAGALTLALGAAPLSAAPVHARTLILCKASGTFKRVGRVHPRTCTTLGPFDAFCCAFNLRKLRWSHWGQSTAAARGIERGFHLPLANINVRVRAFRRRRAVCGNWVYTRVKATSRYGSFTQKFPRVCRDP